MSRPTNATNSRHRKDNYSLEIKAPYRSGSVYTPFAKKRMIDEKLFLRLKTQTTHNVSMHDKDDGKKRRFSLSTSLTQRSQKPQTEPFHRHPGD